MNKNEKTELVPVWEKAALTLEEAVVIQVSEGTSFANCQTEKTATLFCGSGERDFLREKNWTNTSRSPFPSKKGEPLWEKQ